MIVHTIRDRDVHILSSILRQALVGRLTPLALATEEFGVEELVDIWLRVVVLLLAVGVFLLRLGESFAKFYSV